MEYCYTTIVGLGISYLLYLIFLKKEKTFQFNRIFLLGSLVLCLLAPIIQLDFANTFPDVQTIEIEKVVEEVAKKVFLKEIPTGQTVEKLERGIDYMQIFFFVYLVISTFFLIRFLQNIYFILKVVNNSGDQRIGNLKIIPVEEKSNPYSFFRYLFINRKDLENETISKSVLEHELAHSRQFHSLDVFFLEVLTCFFWFNPFLWLYKKAIVENHEFLADAAVINKGIDLSCYSHQLVQTGNKSHNSPLLSGFNFSQTKNRILMLYKKRTSKSVIGLKIGMVLTLFSIVFAFSSFTDSSGDEPFVVVVDAGHGGRDSGIYDEKTINLQVAKKLAALGEKDGVQIVLIRTTDEFISLSDRVEFVKEQNADMLLSLHCNSSKDETRTGVVAYYARDGKKKKLSYDYSKILVSNYLEEITDQGEISEVGFIILQDLKIPGVMVEMGFLSNKNEARQLENMEHQQEIAENLYESLLEIKETR